MKQCINFFEWSDLTRQPITFKHVSDFEHFCKKSKIVISSNNEFYLTNYPELYITCVKGKPELVISGDMKNLKKNLSKRNKK